ncbi:NAD(P)H-dependent FMN reductase [Ekhidna lutea]|uniref:NAD(P)H-dependent FMN reductase n=1 Tax=Ekhidna lutea TaxID=447679 RepID=A0A239L524_EKHLU|nr:NAD(P)H-dependent oxidoreductase [Ekhidna lutea]SNT25008.1 NAD(P)H-dependent FMN reductase [Ekhidna lutea]
MITIISGTNRKNSISMQVALQYQEILKSEGADSTIIDLEKLPNDFISSALYENQGTNVDFNPIRDHMKEAQKFVFIVPEYNGSFPGILKTFLDALEFPGTLKGKKCAIVGLSSGMQGAVMAMSHLTDIFNYLGMHVLANKPKLMRINGKMEAGKITDESYTKRLKDQAKAIISF